ncbi:MAG TPA: isoprenylcysteine carboxylmethyltransferase family protein [Anaerolineae bacterium]
MEDRTTKFTISAFLTFVIVLAAQRLFELRLSQRNEARLRAQGGREVGAEHFGWMKALHTTWFVAMIIEVWWFRRVFKPLLAAFALLLFLIGQSLRYAAIRTLGSRWTANIMTLPGAPPMNDGIYRYVRHPNYLGVMLEIGAVPLLHSAYLTSVIFSLANTLILMVRIRAEERALDAQGQYKVVFDGRPRFIPWKWWRW